MKRRKPIKRGKPPKRTALKRALPKDHVEADAFREAVLDRAKRRCEIGPILCAASDPDAIMAGRRCRGTATQAHHRQPRGMGGHGENDPANGYAACSFCHPWVESHRSVAYELGLLLRHTPR